MFRKKGQAAMEFLMTYGWAILVVLVAIGALAYFGVLSPDKFLPERCTGPAGLDCIDKASISVTNAEIAFVVKNNLGFNVAFNVTTSNTATISDDCTGTIPATWPQVNGQDITGDNSEQVNNAGQATVVFRCGDAISAGRFKSTFGLPYRNLNSGLDHKAQVSVTGVAS